MIFLTKEELDRTEWLVDVDDKLKTMIVTGRS